MLRIEPGLHAALREAARSLGVSLNEYCARKLAAPTSAAPAPAVEVVRRGASVLSDALLGVVAFGSWARQEQRDSSDVDVLLVVDSTAALNRELYRRWDAEPLTWEGHPVEPHFVHMPPPRARISGLWAEAAVEGVVLFDRDLSLSRRLVEIRRRIVAGEVLRREVHGQRYWIGPT